jgi:hypothetical protein
MANNTTTPELLGAASCSAFTLAPGDVEGALKKVLEYIRIRQREIREKQDRCHDIGAEESKKALMDRYEEIDCVAEVVNQLRWIAKGRPNAEVCRPARQEAQPKESHAE